MLNFNSNTEIVSVINQLNSQTSEITKLEEQVQTTKENLIQFSRQVLFPNHYGTNPLFLRGISDEDKMELRKFLFPNYYNTKSKSSNTYYMYGSY
jgi:hypothetical protein